jgi:hypothetical protein
MKDDVTKDNKTANNDDNATADNDKNATAENHNKN